MRTMSEFRMLNGYVLRYRPNHHRAIQSGGEVGYVYEHVLVVERTLGRRLRRDEEVHHLDLWRSNNAPDNLIVIPVAAHQRLHAWMNRGMPIYGQTMINMPDRISTRAKIRRCPVCATPLDVQEEHCSVRCAGLSKRVCSRPSKEKLVSLLIKHSWLAIGKHYGVSDNAVRKWARSMNIDPARYARGKQR